MAKSFAPRMVYDEPLGISINNNRKSGEPYFLAGSHVVKAASSDDDRRIVEQAADSAGVSLSSDEVDDFVQELSDYATDSGRAGYAQVGADTTDDLFDQINARAIAWADQHVADLVAQIDETTRDEVRSAVENGLAAGMSTDEIAESISDIGAFSDMRSALIANTEVANANSAGALVGYKTARDAGVDVRKEWLVDDEPCDICQGNADDGAIDLDEEFSSGDDAPSAHPHCLCSLSPVVVESNAKVAKAAREFECV